MYLFIYLFFDVDEAMPLWTSKLIKHVDAYSFLMKRTVADALKRFSGEIESIRETQKLIVKRLFQMEKKVDDLYHRRPRKKVILLRLGKNQK